MKTGKLVCGLLRALAMLAVLVIFVILDWYPMVKDLGRLRRERGDLELHIKNYSAMAGNFEFPDAAEDSLLAGADLRRVLLQAEREGAWEAAVLSELRERAGKDGIRCARALIAPPTTELEDIGRGGGDLLVEWINRRQAAVITGAFAIAVDSGRFLWQGAFTDLNLDRGQRPAIRPMAIVLSAPLPVLLRFVNHLSWGRARLELVRLHLEPGIPDSRAWMVVRGHFLAGYPSAWELRQEEDPGEGLLVDPDSPLLWRKVDQGSDYRVEKKELLPPGSPW